MNKRHLRLKELAEFKLPTEEISAHLKEFSWDYEGEPYILTKAHVVDILSRFNSKELNATNIEDWANLIECREDLEFELAYEKELSELIYLLANPALEGAITNLFCSEAIRRLNSK